MILSFVSSHLVILVLVCVGLMLPHLWPPLVRGLPKRRAEPITPTRHRSREPKPCTGLTPKPPVRCVSQGP